MKLFVIVLCLLSERYLVHSLSHRRFNWFPAFFAGISERLGRSEPSHFNQALILALVVLIPIVIVWLIFYLLGSLFFGFIAFLLNLVIFYYCLGPQNPFYPVRDEAEENNEVVVSDYFAKVNGELFAVIFWYILLGPLGVLFYRLVSLCREQLLTSQLAQVMTNILDWVPARLSVLLYLLVGNFQRGIHFLGRMFLASPEKNSLLLGEGGLLAARTTADESISMPQAEHLVEQALIVLLVFLALFTLISWL
ncbi:hypothetical protein [Legionella jordanis]|uniref:Inner membrane protein AmpE n=1 Tax=Legionella jordanis TaxID=456 RepID=A0A0W0V8F3_9GAMM|nr:hypothetical protein [Legionella jordanis]KTD16166.1 inner membrane protein AmpE [Legionella jordanis]RMX04609.1 hypothetical protein EAW55_04015 [Legionella jordanis]RMX18318.1 hypothetical protein EAS68_08200 [Legionella jordanis]VEH12374.1 inner membrane protein AmpE [Legionella jordanis]HAT8713888.1 hypothetical protein [Legionella jordanis]